MMGDNYCEIHQHPKVSFKSGNWCPMCESGERMDMDKIMSLVKNQRRREVVIHLMSESSTNISPLSTEIAASENNKPKDKLSSDERKRVYVSLYQSHLSKLNDVDVIDYDKNSGRISKGDRFWEVSDFIKGVLLMQQPLWSIVLYRTKRWFSVRSRDMADKWGIPDVVGLVRR